MRPHEHARRPKARAPPPQSSAGMAENTEDTGLAATQAPPQTRVTRSIERPSDEDVDAMLEMERQLDNQMYGDAYDTDGGVAPSTPTAQLSLGPPQEWFSPSRRAQQVAPVSIQYVDDEEFDYLAQLAQVQEPGETTPVSSPPESHAGPPRLSTGSSASSALPPAVAPALAVPRELMPLTLRRARSKRPPTAQEQQEQKARNDFEKYMNDTIATGPFSEGLMSFGHRLPNEVYNAVRVRYCLDWKKNHPELVSESGSIEAQKLARASFAKDCTLNKRLNILKQLVSEQSTQPERAGFVRTCEAVMAQMKVKTADEKHVSAIRARGQVLLFVYNHDNLIIHDLKQDATNLLAHDDIIALVQGHPPYQRLKEAFFDFANKQAKLLQCEMACSLEISPERYKADGTVRVHLNLALGHKQIRIQFTAPFFKLMFGRILPTYAPKTDSVHEAQMIKRAGFAKWWGQAAYYLQFPKEYMLDNTGTKLPFKDYPVSQTTIMAYLQVF